MHLRDCHNFHDFRRLARRRVPGPIFDYIDGADPAIDDLWIREAKDRLMAYRRGDLAAKDLSEIVAKYGLWLSGS